MFSQTSLVKLSSAISSSFSHSCDIFEFLPFFADDGSSSFAETLVHSSVPCRLSFSSADVARDTSVASGISQNVLLFLPVDVCINPGSKFVVFHDDCTSVFENASPSSLYPTHQQVKLRLFSEWA